MDVSKSVDLLLCMLVELTSVEISVETFLPWKFPSKKKINSMEVGGSSVDVDGNFHGSILKNQIVWKTASTRPVCSRAPCPACPVVMNRILMQVQAHIICDTCFYLAFLMLWATCAPLNALGRHVHHSMELTVNVSVYMYQHTTFTEPVSLSYEYCRVFLVTRSRADGAWGGEQGGVNILCVRPVVLQRRSGPVACSASRNLDPPFHNWSTMEAPTKLWPMRCFLSYWYLLTGQRVSLKLFF